ncbi:MAG: hypothetical protein HC844_02905 [Tabrizicola sp.]|nr:hypothetical protein [Tabrizicola sp.]
MKAVAVIALVAATPAFGVDVHFCWIGNEGYRMTGRMTYPDHLADAERITGEDVTAFEITGYRDASIIGTWSLAERGPDTAWNLNFLPREMRFATGGLSYGPDGQDWNAGGGVDACGVPGFGFNSGSAAQDICLDGIYAIESGIPPDTPLPVRPVDTPLECGGELQLSEVR